MEYRVEECFDMADSLKMLKKKKKRLKGSDGNVGWQVLLSS